MPMVAESKHNARLLEKAMGGKGSPDTSDEHLSNFEKVRDFHDAFGLDNPDKFCMLDANTLRLRWKLIDEEISELKDAIDEEDKQNIAKELIDVLYVVYGMGACYGIDVDGVFAEVHRSNMSKLGPDGKPIFRDDGKVMKGDNYAKPDLTNLVK